MHFITYVTLTALATTAVAHPKVSNKDLDGSVWKALQSHPPATNSFQSRNSNRPFRRQSGWNPPSDLATPLDEVWKHYESTYEGGIDATTTWGWHQIMSNKGYLNICVRWDSSATVTEAQRTKIASAYAAQYQKWFKWVYGYNGFPYSNVDVKVVGWAVRDTSLLQGSTSGIDVYTDKDAEGIPMCSIGCARDAHRDGDYSQCPGGVASHFDQELHLTDGLEGGFGSYWGQQVGREYMINNLDSDNIHILLHEMGHTFGLDDFYDWTPTGVTNFIMLAGSAMEVTDFDGWMFRNWWYYLSQKNSWASASSSSTTMNVATTAAPAISSKPATTSTSQVSTSKVTASKPTSTTKANTAKATTSGGTVVPTTVTGVVAKYGQCGGQAYTGATTCATGSTCSFVNNWYSQCI